MSRKIDTYKMIRETPQREKFIEDFLDYLKNIGLVNNKDTKKIGEIKANAFNLYQMHGDNENELNEGKKKIEKELIINEAKVKKEYEKSEIKIKDKSVENLQNELYEKLGINKETHKNYEQVQFIKGFIDVSLLQNADLVMYLKENGTELFSKIFEELSNMSVGDIIDLFKSIIKSISESIGDLINGNPYEKGKSIAEIGIPSALLLTIGKKVLKKEVIKNTENSIKSLKDDLEIQKVNNFDGIKIDKDILKIDKIEGNINETRTKIIEILMLNKNIKKIEISNNHETKEILNNIISKNYPLIEVTRIIPNGYITNITFGGIKKLNDNLGQEFTDLLLNNLQNKFKENFRNTNLGEGNARIIRSNYKNITFSSQDLDNKIFWNGRNKEEIINDLIQKLSKDIDDEAIKVGKSRDEIEKLIKENLDFSAGTSKLKEDGDLKEKLKVFYEAEISSKKGIGDNELNDNIFDINDIYKNAQNAINIEKEIFNKFDDKYFRFSETDYKVVITDIDGNKSINPILLRYVRKYSDDGKIEPKELNDLVKNYISELNSGFDFISPSINLEKDLEIAQRINDGMKKGELSRDDILYTYKGTLSKEAFFSKIKGKSGVSSFIDIRDMGIDNLGEFRILRDKINTNSLSEDDLLKAGNKVTKKFINTVSELKSIYGDKIKISLGGDEMYIFVEGVNKNNCYNFLEDLNNVMNKNNMKSRITHNFSNTKESFADLDKLTLINKKIEEKIEKIVTDNKKESILKTPENISLNIEKGIEEKIIYNIDDLTKAITNKIDDKILNFISQPIDGKYIDLGNINGFRVEFRGGKNSLMEINITKI